ncbi:amidohydrolase family protein [Nocardia sp. CDC159]|uniref:Amidohydrolase family protein n=1 Tax=Nocardia pulmonis TaxID=2951408 RepID=A0A9X2ECJ6_9NOCA|nr:MULTISPECIES: amidohydrolase family protein [Nocardia]MCM6775546.1 amidohydrolase family protein [Nocardia pulmonis]MCM6787720.1 amidohydrolase family protein [Nocardia sp. CDC159]
MSSVLITAGRLIVGPADKTIDDAALLLEGTTIVACGGRVEVAARAPESAVRLDFPDATMLPGLIDAHVHLALGGERDPITPLRDRSPVRLALDMAGRAQRALAAGVTTVRDLGDPDGMAAALRDAIAAGAVAGPRILTATVPLTCPGGHLAAFGGEVASDREIRERVRRNAELGADLIKVMASGGALTPGGPPMWAAQFDAGQLRYIVEQAAELGLAVAAHAHGTETIAHCVAAGVRTVEHCSWRTADGLRYDEAVTAELVRRDVFVCRCISGDWRAFLAQLGQANADALCDAIRRMRRAGARFIAGTDAGVPGAPFGEYAGMLEFFAEIGFGNDEVIDMATVTAAEALGIADRTGRLESGCAADVLVVEGDPRAELRSLRVPRLVVARGRIHRPVPGNEV